MKDIRKAASPIIHGSCEDLSGVEDESIALTVTSPPYWNAVDYDIHSKNPEAHYRTRRYAEGFQGYGDYLEWLTRIFDGIYAKTKPGGFACIVLGTVLFEKRHLPVPFDLTSSLCEKTGWLFHQDIIWHKVTGGVKRAGVFIQKPYPGYFYPNIMTEYILVFRKPGAPIYQAVDAKKKKSARTEIGKFFVTEMANSVWHIAPVPPGHLEHPCPFPEEIPHRLIQLYSYPGDLVFDPFCGTGQTLKVAKHLNRKILGFEIMEAYARYAKQRLEEPLKLRRHQLLAVFEKTPTI